MANSPSKSSTTRTTEVLNSPPLPKFASVKDSGISKPKSESKSHRIWFSDVVVKRSESSFVNRKWSSSDIRRLGVMIVLHGLAMFGPFTFSWPGFWVAFVLYQITGFGISLSFHRNLAHSSLRLPKCLEYLFAYFGSLALQGDPITWVGAHRLHHKFCDSKQDPHSPLGGGFWFSHINWIFDTNSFFVKRGELSNTEDLKKQPFYRFMRRTYLLHSLALALLLYALGGFSYVVWGMGVRTIFLFHITFFLNSVCHIWGHQAWNTGDLSKNNWLMGILVGEGWHNNHHAFEYSARLGLEWWQIDATWYIIMLLEALGLAKDVKLPTEAHKQRLSFKSEKEKA